MSLPEPALSLSQNEGMSFIYLLEKRQLTRCCIEQALCIELLV
jgi:hypothetical protein